MVIAPDTAWKLFSESWKPDQVLGKVQMLGNLSLAKQALNIY